MEYIVIHLIILNLIQIFKFNIKYQILYSIFIIFNTKITLDVKNIHENIIFHKGINNLLRYR